MKIKTLSISIIIFGLLYYALSPIYSFYSHKDKLPLMPWGHIQLPQTAPYSFSNNDPRLNEIESQINQTIQEHRENIAVPGLSVAIAQNNNLIWTSASGWSDLESNIAMSPNTQLRVGSTSKALTSAGLARLVQQEKVTLDTMLVDIYEELPNPLWRDITPRQLSSHMSGVPHYGQNTEFSGMLKTVSLTTYYESVGEAVELFDASELRFSPAEKFEYSSLGTVLLSHAMEKTAGVSYQTWMRQQVFEPMKLSATSIEKEATNLASFYKRVPGKENTFTQWRDVDLSHRLAGGGWVSTSTDLALFGQGFMQDDFLDPSIRDEFWTPQKLSSGEVNHQNYAIGWRRNQFQINEQLGSVTYYHHGGVSRGAQSFLLVIPEYQLSLAININAKTENFSDFAQLAGTLTRKVIGAL